MTITSQPGWAVPGFAVPGQPFFIASAESADLGTISVGALYSPWTVGGLDMDTISVLSTVYLYAPVTCTLPDGTGVDPTSAGLSFAFLPSGSEPTEDTSWYAGNWMTTGSGYAAQVLFGPAGSGALSAGEYAGFMKITNAPEEIIIPVGPVTTY